MTLDAPVLHELDRLNTITLAELLTAAELQTRVDRKYALTVAELDRLQGALPSDTRMLQINGRRDFAYESRYFDTPALASYHLAAHRRRRRFKIRTRTYLDSSQSYLEVKTRGGRGYTIKDRIPNPGNGFGNGSGTDPGIGDGREFIARILDRDGLGSYASTPLTHTLTTRYRRTTLYLPDTGSRVTIDTELQWCDATGNHLTIPGLAIVETKTGSTASSVDRLLWSQRLRPIRISKYATGMAALHPELPSNRWNRTLTRHFFPQNTLCFRESSCAGIS